MSMPESKLEAAAANVTTELAKAKAWYQRYSTWVALGVGLLAGAVVGHQL